MLCSKLDSVQWDFGGCDLKDETCACRPRWKNQFKHHEHHCGVFSTYNTCIILPRIRGFYVKSSVRGVETQWAICLVCKMAILRRGWHWKWYERPQITLVGSTWKEMAIKLSMDATKSKPPSVPQSNTWTIQIFSLLVRTWRFASLQQIPHMMLVVQKKNRFQLSSNAESTGLQLQLSHSCPLSLIP